MPVDDFVIASRTQSAEEIKATLEKSGYDGVAEGEEPQQDTAVEQDDEAQGSESSTAAQGTEQNTSEQSADAGDEDAGDEDGESGADAEAAQTTQEQQPQAKKPKGGFQRTIAKLREQNAALARRLAETSPLGATAKTEPAKPAVAETKPAMAAETKPPAASETKATPKPKWDDFADADNQFEAYSDALSAWNREQVKRELAEQAEAEKRQQREASAQAAMDAERKAIEQRLNGMLSVARAKYSDFDQVLNTPGAMASDAMKIAMHDSDSFGDIAYWLGKHPEESQRIAGLTDLKAGASEADKRKALKLAYREIEKIEAQIAAEDGAADDNGDEGEAEEEQDVVATPVVSKSRPPQTPPPAPVAEKPKPQAATPKPKPEPPKPVGARGGAVTKTLSQMTAEEKRRLTPDQYRAMREKEGYRF